MSRPPFFFGRRASLHPISLCLPRPCRWSHLRISKVVLFCFYKNVMLVCTQFLFALLNGFSGAQGAHFV